MVEKRTTLDKLNEASPYNIFYNEIPELPRTSNQTNSIKFHDLLCPSLGTLQCSLQIASKIDINWLMSQYEIRNVGGKPLTILYSEPKPDVEEYVESHFPNVTQHRVVVASRDKFGSHHARMGIYVYEDNSLRVVISTANLNKEQWDCFNHAFWVSPLCRALPEASSTEGESPTNFKKSLLSYLERYELPSVLDFWIRHIQRADFSDVKVFLVTSFPGTYPPGNLGSHLQQVEDLLKKHSKVPAREEPIWPIVAQASCLGQYGESPNNWLGRIFLNRLARQDVKLKIIYPTWKQVKNGHFGSEIVGEGLRYLRAIHNRQQWVQRYLYQWSADKSGRSAIMPHTKMYCRVSPLGDKIAWFLLTSSNINRGAWGQEHYSNKDDIYVRNHELGVMFLPKFFGEEYFRVKFRNPDEKVFPVMFDLPLKKYGDRDYPWTVFTMKRII